MTTYTNQQWLVKNFPEGLATRDDFDWKEMPVSELKEGEVLVRHIYLSLDPTNRIWLTGAETYLPPLKKGDIVRGIGIGVVEASLNPKFQPGQHVQGMFGWQKYLVSKGEGLTALPPLPGVPLTAHFGLFGHIGLTAYVGLMEIGQPKASETVVVSTAAGAVGSIVAQLAKIQGCRVIGTAGSDEKCQWLQEELGLDGAINYKKEDLKDSLAKHCPDGIDVYFDNVGGALLDAVLTQINVNARIPLCGLISTYNAKEPVPGPYHYGQILIKRATVKGFIVTDHLAKGAEVFQKIGKWYAEGKLQYRVDVVEGLENAPQALNKLFEGTNQGKLILQVSEE